MTNEERSEARLVVYCRPPTCRDTKGDCLDATQAIIMHLR
jgi:hypothetical protein